MSHMSWCTGAHTDDGECELEQVLELGETSRIILAAAACSDGQVNLWAEVWAYDLDELDQVIAALTALRPTLAASSIEADCAMHDHP